MTIFMCHKTPSLLTTVAIALFMFFSGPAIAQSESLTSVSEEVFQEKNNQKYWQIQRSKRIKSSEGVQLYLKTINQGEYSDWRLPTKQELSELFSIFDLKENGQIKIRLEGKYWLAENKQQPYVGTWEIGDQCGPTRSFSTDKAGYVRAIRP